jgi:hypothetical protein
MPGEKTYLMHPDRFDDSKTHLVFYGPGYGRFGVGDACGVKGAATLAVYRGGSGLALCTTRTPAIERGGSMLPEETTCEACKIALARMTADEVEAFAMRAEYCGDTASAAALFTVVVERRTAEVAAVKALVSRALANLARAVRHRDEDNALATLREAKS